MQFPYQHSRTAICHIMDALSALYNCKIIMVKQDIIAELEQLIDQEIGVHRIVSFFETIVLSSERDIKNYKGTESFLRFLS